MGAKAPITAMGLFDFLNQQQPSGGGSMVSDIIALGSLFGPKQNVLDSRDFAASMDQADVNNTLNIARSNEFLSGVTPTNAAMYNQYQDATYNEETSRQITRIQRTADALGMSPWELQGNNLTTPIPSDMGGGGRANAAPQYMASVMPAAIASMQSKTQLAIARMNNETALQMKGMDTAGGELPKANVAKIRADIAGTLQGMDESRSRQTLIAADVILRAAQTTQTQEATNNLLTQRKFLGQQIKESEARTANTTQQTKNLQQTYDIESIRKELLRNEDFRKSIILLADIAPKETWYQPGGSTTQIMDGSALVKLAKNLTIYSGSNNGQINNAALLDDMNDIELSDAMKVAAATAGVIKDLAETGGKTAKAALDNAKRLTPSEY